MQGQRRHAITRGRGIVVAGLGAVNQLLVIVTGEKEAAMLAILKLLEQSIRECARELHILDAKLALHQLQQSVEQKRVVIQVGVQVRLAVLVRGQQLAIAP